jgi:hypothetical protein
MKKIISHSRLYETAEMKAKWFQSLSLEERMDMLCSFTDMILQNNPNIMELKNVKPTSRRIQILRKSPG